MSQASTGLSQYEKKASTGQQHEKDRRPPRRARRLIRPKEAQERLGVSRTTFWDSFIGTKRLRLVRLGPKSVAVVEDELDDLIQQMIDERDASEKAA
jgi:predicted DNA-binding transcriptional regulator AlpA